jgi:hypothetical protein
MLLFNLTGLSDAQIHKMIWARCKAYGSVKSVSIHRRSTLRPGAFALVGMSGAAEVDKVIKGIGDVLFGGAALIQLSQDALSGEDGIVVPCGGPYVPARSEAHGASEAFIRTLLDTSAGYFRDGWRTPTTTDCAALPA